MKMMVNDLQCYQYPGDAEQSEITLVHSAQSGNLESFNLIVLKYQDMMFRTALRILEQDDLAGDATQEALLSAYQHIHFFRSGSLKSWLMRILINKCYDELRRLQRTGAVSLDQSTMDEDENLYTRLPELTPSVEECVETSERNKCIQEGLNKLPVDYRVIILLIDVEEMSYNEASTILKIPVGTVKSRLARARFNLRSTLAASQI